VDETVYAFAADRAAASSPATGTGMTTYAPGGSVPWSGSVIKSEKTLFGGQAGQGCRSAV
jgi:hypothetical protein